jgi:hypothetical protein
MKKIAVVAVGVVCVLAGTAVAQVLGDVTTRSLIWRLSLRLDSVQARLDAQGAPAQAWASADIVGTYLYAGVGHVTVQGWAFSCSSGTYWDSGHAVVVIDDIEVPLWPNSRVDRADVVSAFAGACPGNSYVPLHNGVNYDIPLTWFEGGVDNNGWHAVKLRSYDSAGRMFETAYTFVHNP